MNNVDYVEEYSLFYLLKSGPRTNALFKYFEKCFKVIEHQINNLSFILFGKRQFPFQILPHFLENKWHFGLRIIFFDI